MSKLQNIAVNYETDLVVGKTSAHVESLSAHAIDQIADVIEGVLLARSEHCRFKKSTVYVNGSRH